MKAFHWGDVGLCLPDFRFCQKNREGGYLVKRKTLSITHPKIAAEWHPTKYKGLGPAKLKPRSGKRIWWRCKEGHEWQATIHNRAGAQGTDCPYCSGRLVTPETSLAALAPERAKEWHPTKNGGLQPEDVALNYSKRVWWQCKRGHEWQTTPNCRERGTGCPFCNSVATSRLELGDPGATRGHSIQSLQVWNQIPRVGRVRRALCRVGEP